MPPHTCTSTHFNAFQRTPNALAFGKGHRGVVHVHCTTFRLWNDQKHKWVVHNKEGFKSYVKRWATWLLDGVQQLPEFTEVAARSKHARSIVNGNALAEQVIGELHAAASEDPVQFDENPLLLGFDNGVLDLLTCTFRTAVPEDYVSMSTGYDMPDEVDSAELASFEGLMAQIYPVQEERDLVQTFAGYSLMGHTDEKYFLVLTDRREGHNGKSTVVKFFNRALAGETMKGGYKGPSKQELLYESKAATSVNSHDAGVAAYDKVRLACFEEFTAKSGSTVLD